MATSAARQEADLDDRTGQLQRRIGALEGQLRRVQRLASVGTLTAMVAHEFNNILTPMLNYAQLAAGGDDRMRAKALACTLDGATRAEAICRAILDFTAQHAQAGQTVQTVRLSDLLDQTLLVMARALGKDGIRLIKRVPPRLALATRPVELKQVLLNLILNARSAVLKKGRGQTIVISARRSGGAVLIRVADTGVGIRPENLQRIFEPFFTTNGGSGAGLGLAVCRHIAAGMKGELSVRSQAGKGACFTLSLPADGVGARHCRAPGRLQPAAAG